MIYKKCKRYTDMNPVSWTKKKLSKKKMKD